MNHNTLDDEETREMLLKEMRQYRDEYGIYAADMLETARLLLDQLKQHPRQVEAAAYCIRQAVVEIFGDTRDYTPLSDVVRRIIEAKDRMQTEGTADDEVVQNLCMAINDLNDLVCRPKPEARLKEIFRGDTGIDPEDGPNSLIREYRRLKKRSNALAHRVSETRTNAGDVRDHYEKVVDMLAMIFLPSVRLGRIERLAKLPAPQRTDLVELRRIMKNAYGFDYFVSKISSSTWFSIMDADMLKSPSGNPPWRLRSLVWHLKDAHVDAFVGMLEKEFDRWASDDAGLGELGFVGYWLGDDGLPWLVKAFQVSKNVRRAHAKKMQARLEVNQPDHELIKEIERVGWSIWHLDDYALRAFLKAKKPSIKFIELAECLLKSDSNVDRYGRTCDIPARLVKNMNREYAIRIVAILVCELSVRLDGTNMYHISRLSSNVRSHHDHSFRVGCLVANLCGALEKARDLGVSTHGLIGELNSLPDVIKSRFKAWLYSSAADVAPTKIVSYLVDSCSSRPPNSEDDLLLDRLKRDGHITNISDQITHLLGRVPDTKKISGSEPQWDISREDRWRIHWARTMRSWVKLPDEWEQCLDMVYGTPEAERDSGSGQTPKAYGGQDGSALPDGVYADDPLEAARKIASMKPGAGGFPELTGGHSPILYLKNAVRLNTSKWAEKPVEIVKALRHPEYVAIYFSGLADAGEELAPHAARIISAVKLARTLQWDVGASGSSVFYQTGGHTSADTAGMKLIKEIVKNDGGFCVDSLADIWPIVTEAVVLSNPEAVGQLDCSIEYLSTVDGLPHVQAVHTLFEVIRCAKRNNAKVPSTVLARLAKATRLTGQYGVDYHACIGPQARFMYAVAPEWFEQNEQYLFGNGASAELGKVALDMCMMYYPPDALILAKYQNGVLDAIKRGISEALRYMLCGLLWGMHGYAPEHVAKKLMNIGPEYVSKAGGWDMFDLLRKGADAEHVRRDVDFWDRVLKQCPKPEAVVGFGWYAGVPKIDQERFEELMLRTCKLAKKLDWSHKVAERISVSQTITDAGWQILAWLFSIDIGHDKEAVAEHAVDALRRTAGIVNAPESRSHLRNVLVEHGFPDALNF